MNVLSEIVVRSPASGAYAGCGHILTFHHFCKSGTESGYEMRSGESNPETLETVICSYRAKNYEFVSLSEVAERLRSGEAFGKFVALTFDDGYRSFVQDALPTLRKYLVPFTLYVVPGYASGHILKWDYLLEKVISRHALVRFFDGERSYSLKCEGRRKKKVAHFLHGKFERLNTKKKYPLIQRFFETYLPSSELGHSEMMLSWNEIFELSKDPLATIGSHTISHYVLSQMSYAEAEEEIRLSKQKLEEVLGKKVSHLAYPYGCSQHAGSREAVLAERAGYLTAVTTRPGNLFPIHRQRLQLLPRYNINLNADEFLLDGLRAGTYAPLKHYSLLPRIS